MKFACLNALSVLLQEFPYEDDVPPYAILSHRWGHSEDEVSYSDFCTGQKLDTPGYRKIEELCRKARQHGFKYCWIDTCCINKDSSAELSESINSMYRWYARAGICFAYLADVPDHDFSQSEWFRRGWTLQELLAPRTLHLFNGKWQSLGTKESRSSAIEKVTGIPVRLLRGTDKLGYYSIAQRMSWASSRTTSRREDEAYCLLGLFNINMPLLYGEGYKAFQRLQELIMQTSSDHTLFAWGVNVSGVDDYVMSSSLLAPSPADFAPCSNVRHTAFTQPIFYEVTNQGVAISLHRSFDERLLRLLSLEHGVFDCYAGPEVALSVPLNCYILEPRSHVTLWLHLRYHAGSWWRFGIQARSAMEFPLSTRPQALAYSSDHIRLYVMHLPPGSMNGTKHDSAQVSDCIYLGLLAHQRRSMVSRFAGLLL